MRRRRPTSKIGARDPQLELVDGAIATAVFLGAFSRLM
jgi:hypothetical protein